MKTGLVLEGGAMRGMFTAGVLDVFMEHNITFDGLVGVSAGAAFGCSYKSRQLGRTIRYNKKYCTDKRYCSLWSLITTGDMYGVDFCYRELPEVLDVFDNDAFDGNPMEFHIVACDVETGKPIYKICNKASEGLIHWLQASASMPLVSKVVEIGGYKLLDGGICDSIPLRYFEEKGFDRNIVILTQPEDYRKKPNKAMPLIKLFLKNYPKVIEAMANRHLMYNGQAEYVSKREKTGEILVLRPEKKLDLFRTEKNPDKLQAAYDIGRETALSRLAEIKEFLNQE